MKSGTSAFRPSQLRPHVMPALILAFILSVFGWEKSAKADWHVQIKRDAVTGRLSRTATLPGTNGAALVEACREGANGWWEYLSLIVLPLPEFLSRAERRIRYRLDDGPLHEFTSVAENGIFHAPGGGGVEWMSMLTESGARSLTIETYTDTGTRFVSMFDLRFSSVEAAATRNQLRWDCFLNLGR